MNDSWHSYPSIYNLGHAALGALFSDPVLIEEKVDGSQFSFGIFNGEVKARSRGQQLHFDEKGECNQSMFNKAVQSVLERKDLLRDGWTYRGEFLGKPKHNTLGYERVPNGHIIVFDVTTGHETYLTSYAEKKAEAERIGLEIVPLIHDGEFNGGADEFRQMIDRDSVLGGCKVEGVVIKNYFQFGPDKKVLLGKHVSEAFKEIHNKEWKKSNPTGNDILQHIGDRLRAEGRWNKAIQRLRESGELTNSPKDIGPLLKSINQDIDKECIEEITKELLTWALPSVKRMGCHGFPEWYKQQLIDKQFEVSQ